MVCFASGLKMLPSGRLFAMNLGRVSSASSRVSCPRRESASVSKPLPCRRPEMFFQCGLVATRMIDSPRVRPSAVKWLMASP